jgi:hypothetical protein
MNESMKVTVEEWANNNSININDKQIRELVDAIDICSEIDMGSTGWVLGYKNKSNEEKEIEKLEKKLFTLERFIQQKGFSISYDIGHVTEHTMESISDSHRASRSKTTYY